MRKFISVWIAFLFAPFLFAANPKPVPVNEDAFLVQKEIMTWATDQTFDGQVQAVKCQAVRLDDKWFLTSAHCVYSACATRPCTVEVTLAESSGLLARAWIKHSTASQSVFIYKGYFPGQNRINGRDIALIQMDPSKTEYMYLNLEDGTPLTQEMFQSQLALDPEARAQFNAQKPLLLSVANTPTVQLKSQIVVPKTTAGVISYLTEPLAEAFYVKDLQHYVAPSFGVQQTNSGGGVFTHTGTLAGLVSSVIYAKDGGVSFHDNEGKTVFRVTKAQGLFLFTGFNGETLSFIRQYVPHVRTVNALPDLAATSKKDFNQITQAIEATSRSF